MAAGDSAGAEAERQRALASAHERAAEAARNAAARYGLAHITEKRTALALAPLAAIGYHLLGDRRWPGTKRGANVDLIVIGPGGVFITDTKAWAEVTIANQRIYRGEADVTDDLSSLIALTETTQADLAEVGLAPGEVRPIVVLAGMRGVDAWLSNGIRVLGEHDACRAIAAHGSRLTGPQVDTVLARALALFPEPNAPAPVVATVPEPVVPPRPPADLDSLVAVEDVSEVMLARLLAEPIEQWMAFLHPQQAKLVRRSFPGPSRVRGPAGTGKTVVGLHRAAHLARHKPGRILVTTFVRTLPNVLEQTLQRFAPETSGRVDFMGVHAFAYRLLGERGVDFDLDPKGSRDAFAAAWRTAGGDRLPLAGTKGRHYWDEEIQYVLKGRGITRFEEYADLARTGRRQRLTVGDRKAVWELYQAYDAELRERGIIDYADLILLAEAELAREPQRDLYSSVIVDEAQDLSCAAVRMLHSLVGDEPDGFTLIGDGQQSIYPGGYTLAEAGLSVAGRGVVLDINYRNTAEIVDFAQHLVDGDQYADIEGVISIGDVPSSVPRSGPRPVVAEFASDKDLHSSMVERVQRVTADPGTTAGDVAVLCLTRFSANAAAGALRRAGIPLVSLEKYDGKPVDAVKVGTIKRAKGLEFKQVLLPGVRRNQTSMQAPEVDNERERWDLTRRELFVGMTRARDGLWLGLTD